MGAKTPILLRCNTVLRELSSWAQPLYFGTVTVLCSHANGRLSSFGYRIVGINIRSIIIVVIIIVVTKRVSSHIIFDPVGSPTTI